MNEIFMARNALEACLIISALLVEVRLSKERLPSADCVRNAAAEVDVCMASVLAACCSEGGLPGFLELVALVTDADLAERERGEVDQLTAQRDALAKLPARLQELSIYTSDGYSAAPELSHTPPVAIQPHVAEISAPEISVPIPQLESFAIEL